MAIPTIRTLSQLKSQCNELGLSVKIYGKKEQKDDYVKALREYFIQEKYQGKLPQALSMMLSLESPMLCAQFKSVKEDVQEKLWTSNQYYAEEKEDGNRMIHFFLDIYEAFSRNNSVADFLPVAYGEKIYFRDVDWSKVTDKFVLDSEVICSNPNVNTIMGSKGVITETQLQATTAILSMNADDSIRLQRDENCDLIIKSFDCLWFNGEWLLDKPLKERRKYLRKAVNQLQEAGFKVYLPKSNISNKKAFYQSVLKAGGEGIVIKDINSPYLPSSSRSHRKWVKVKRSMTESLQMEGIGDTIDGYISGYELADEDKSWSGLIGALHISVNLRDSEGNLTSHMIAKVTNIEMSLRKQMTKLDDNGNPILDPTFYNRVVEVDGQSISARARRLTHAVLVRFRPDRSADTCIMDESFLNSMIL